MGLGLALTARQVVICQARRRRNRIEVARVVSAPLPASALVPSFARPNVQDPQACEDALAAALSRAGIGRATVAVALPDPSLRLRLLPELPRGGTREESERLIAWQLRDILPFPADQSRVDFLPLASAGGPAALCLLASAAVVSQYEALLRRRRLLPIQIGPASLALWNLLELSRRALRRDRPVPGLLCALFVEETHATLIAFAGGTLRLWRCLASDGARPDALVQEVGDSLCVLNEEGALPGPPRILVHAATPQGGGDVGLLRRELPPGVEVEEVAWPAGLPADPAVLPALGAALCA